MQLNFALCVCINNSMWVYLRAFMCVSLTMLFQCSFVNSNQNKTRLLGRQVVKLVTPGTLIEPLNNSANYLLSIATGPRDTVGIAWVDISTGEFQVSI